MLDRYTEDARKVIFLARYEASRLNSPALEPAHLWLGLLRQAPKLVRQNAPGITADAQYQQLPPHDPDAERVSLTVEIPLSPSAAAALTAAATHADHYNQPFITPHFLILGLLASAQTTENQPPHPE